LRICSASRIRNQPSAIRNRYGYAPSSSHACPPRRLGYQTRRNAFGESFYPRTHYIGASELYGLTGPQFTVRRPQRPAGSAPASSISRTVRHYSTPAPAGHARVVSGIPQTGNAASNPPPVHRRFAVIEKRLAGRSAARPPTENHSPRQPGRQSGTVSHRPVSTSIRHFERHRSFGTPLSHTSGRKTFLPIPCP
jgi:hypothetical protein